MKVLKVSQWTAHFLSLTVARHAHVMLQSQALASQAEKRQRSFDKVVDEWKRKVADLQAELERSQRESRGHAAEVYKLRSQLEESNDSAESLRRDNKNLSG